MAWWIFVQFLEHMFGFQVKDTSKVVIDKAQQIQKGVKHPQEFILQPERIQQIPAAQPD